MRSELFRLLRITVTLNVLSFIGFISFLKNDSLLPIKWMFWGIATYISLYIVTNYLNRAFQFYLLSYMFSVFNGLSLLHNSLLLFLKGEDPISTILLIVILLGAFFTLLGLWSQYKINTSELNSSILEVVESGILDIKNGYWDFASPLKLKSQNEGNSNIKRINTLSKLSPLITAFGFALARTVEGNTQKILIGICLYILSCTIIWASTKYLAFASQLLKWEREKGITIKIH